MDNFQKVVDQELAALISFSEVQARWGISKNTFDRLIEADPLFPRPVSLTGKKNETRRYILNEIRAYLDAKLAARSTAQA